MGNTIEQVKLQRNNTYSVPSVVLHIVQNDIQTLSDQKQEIVYSETEHRRTYKSYSDDCAEALCSRERFVKWICRNMNGLMNESNEGSVWYFDHVIPIYYLYLTDTLKNTVLGWYNMVPVLNRYGFVKNKYIDSEIAKTHLSNLREFLKSENIEIDGNIWKYMDVLTEIIYKGKLSYIPDSITCNLCECVKTMMECKVRRHICISCFKTFKNETHPFRFTRWF
jgi:hypothetical protein